jgi:chromosomal replication initiator protein
MPMPVARGASRHAAATPSAQAERFIAGPENALVRVLADAATRDPTPFNPLVLCGPSGVGKSSLAHLLSHERLKALGLVHVLETTGAELAQSLAQAVETKSSGELRTRYHRCDLLVIDNVAELSGKVAAQQFLVTAIDVLFRRGVFVIATLRKLPQEEAGLLPALASRLSAGLIVPLSPPGDLARRELVRDLAQRLNLPLAEPLIGRLSATGQRGASPTPAGLRRTVLRLASAAEHGGKRIGPELIDQVLAAEQPDPAATVRQMSTAVARHFGVTLTQLKGKSREQTVAQARSLAMYLCREHTDLTFSQIGKLFGHRDHSTVLHACRKAATLASRDPQTVQTIKELTSLLATAANIEIQEPAPC